MKTLSPTYANKRLHSTLPGHSANLVARGKYGRIEVRLVNRRYRLTAVNKQTKQHFSKSYATLEGALIAYNTMKEYWV